MATRRAPRKADGGSVVSTARDDARGVGARSGRSGPQPPLPHERDQALGSAGKTPRRSMKQAHDDLERGLPDTDKAPVMDETYRRLKKGR
jgi:hypothetical protein